MKNLCLDFDGVLHSYSSGWKGIDVIPDPPVPGAMQFLRNAVDCFEVSIFSSRSSEWKGVLAMRYYIRDHLCAELGPEMGTDVYGKLSFPMTKPPAFLSIDDRAVTFTGAWPNLDELSNFKTWQQK